MKRWYFIAPLMLGITVIMTESQAPPPVDPWTVRKGSQHDPTTNSTPSGPTAPKTNSVEKVSPPAGNPKP